MDNISSMWLCVSYCVFSVLYICCVLDEVPHRTSDDAVLRNMARTYTMLHPTMSTGSAACHGM